jgi:outer membrane protein assembly factor BamD (BamD/ComL family)
MPSIDLATLRRVAAMQRRYADSLARQAALARLDEVERRVQQERERRGMQPIMSDTGTVLGWVRTRSQSIGER